MLTNEDKTGAYGYHAEELAIQIEPDDVLDEQKLKMRKQKVFNIEGGRSFNTCTVTLQNPQFPECAFPFIVETIQLKTTKDLYEQAQKAKINKKNKPYPTQKKAENVEMKSPVPKANQNDQKQLKIDNFMVNKNEMSQTTGKKIMTRGQIKQTEDFDDYEMQQALKASQLEFQNQQRRQTLNLKDRDLKEMFDQDQAIDLDNDGDMFNDNQLSAKNSLNNNPSFGSPQEDINLDDYQDVMNNGSVIGDDGTKCPNTPIRSNNQLGFVNDDDNDGNPDAFKAPILNGNANEENQLHTEDFKIKIPEYQRMESILMAQIQYYHSIVKRKIQMKQDVLYEDLLPIQVAMDELNALRDSE